MDLGTFYREFQNPPQLSSLSIDIGAQSMAEDLVWRPLPQPTLSSDPPFPFSVIPAPQAQKFRLFPNATPPIFPVTGRRHV